MDITKKTDVELKAMAYDIVMQNAINQNNLQAIQQELAKREQEKSKEVK